MMMETFAIVVRNLINLKSLIQGCIILLVLSGIAHIWFGGKVTAAKLLKIINYKC